MTEKPAERSRRDRLTEEEVARACDELVAAGERVTIAKVRQQVGGGGNQTVIHLVGAWRENQARAAQAGTLDEQLGEPLRQALLDEVRRHRELGEQQLCGQRDELHELCEVLHRDLSEAQQRAEDMARQRAAIAQELSELRARAGEEQKVAEARHNDTLARARELAEALGAANDAAEHHRLAAARAQGDHHAQVRHGERLEEHLRDTNDALQAARRAQEQAAKEAAVTAAQLAGERELGALMRARADDLQAAVDEAGHRQQRARARARAQKEAIVRLKRRLRRLTAEMATAQPRPLAVRTSQAPAPVPPAAATEGAPEPVADCDAAARRGRRPSGRQDHHGGHDAPPPEH